MKMKVSVNSYQIQNKSYVHSFKLYFCIPFMQFLQWVHHKFRHGSIEPLKDLSIGIPTTFSVIFFFCHTS